MKEKIKLGNEDFVCPHCFNHIQKCICNEHAQYLIHIDKNIQEHIRILNQKGYKTSFCCEGHNSYIYILFAFDYFKNFSKEELPKNFKYNKNNLYYDFKSNISEEEKQMEKTMELKNLLDFCKNLKTYNRIN